MSALDEIIKGAALSFSATARMMANIVAAAEESRLRMRELARVLERDPTELEKMAADLAATSPMTLEEAYHKVWWEAQQ